MNNIVYIADSLYPEYIGGGELNDFELCEQLKEDFNIVKIKSNNVTEEFLINNEESFFIISNFLLLNQKCYNFILNKTRYIIYEHDHKYLRTRNPASYKDYKAPQEQIVNLAFYKNAIAVLSQTSFHKDIIEKNTNLKNVINLSGNLWSLETFKILEQNSKKQKKDFVSIMQTNNWHKNTMDAISFCSYKKMDYKLITPAPYKEFLNNLSENNKFVFFPKTPETLSRICVEARMMNMSVITNKNVGASHEHWFNLKGLDMIDFMKNKRIEIKNIIKGLVYEK